MKKIAILSLVFCLFVPALFAVNDDGTASIPCKKIVLADHSTRAPGQLTTIFAQNNGFRGNMFDMEPITDLTEVTAIDINADPAGNTAEVDVWYRMDTCVGHDLSPTGWMLLGHGSGVAAGIDNPTFIDLAGNAVPFPAGGTYGTYVDITNYPSPGINYTNAAAPKTYANAELSVTCYYGKGDPAFTGSTFSTRVWNGTIYYEAGPPSPLYVSPKEISAWFGGTATFDLFGDGLGGRDYILLCSSSTSPGITLKNGELLELTPNSVFYIMLSLILHGSGPILTDFIGTLDPDGYATASLNLPGHCQLYEDVDLYFAWVALYPSESPSNSVKVTITGAPPPTEEYLWDDGTSENALGWTSGGTAAWIHSFDSGVGDDIEQVCSCFGQAGSGNGPANGTPCDLWVWSDPNQDGEPSDGLVLGTGSGVVANTSTNDFNHYNLDSSTAVVGLFFVGCSLEQAVGVYAAPMDQNTLGLGVSFFGGAYTGSVYGIWDPYNLAGHPIYQMGAIGYDSVWMLRANDPTP